MIRLLLPTAHEGDCSVSGPQHHYLSAVLRVKTGDVLEIFDGQGRAYAAQVKQLNEREAVLHLGSCKEAPVSRPVTVVQGLPKGDKFEWVLQKATELGATAFVPAECTRSVAKMGEKAEKKVQRWQRIAEEAARQCGRADVPTVSQPQPLTQAIAQLGANTVVLILDEEERALPLSFAVAQAENQPLAIVVGPEGGLTREEVKALHGRGAQSVTLGRRVLRTETAALAALAVVRHLDGELG